uniref:LRAT domain-containing protein n=1 Tax=Monopterus albus TaxID=43700 RepID=A0A3Q3IV84_MONAL
MAPTLFDVVAKPGDLIEILRGRFKHWAVYIGGNEVVHLIPPKNRVGAWDLDSSTAQVKRQMLCDVVDFYHFSINNLLDDEYTPRDGDSIVRDACSMVGMDLPYNVETCNCQHFALELRYGRPECRQSKMVERKTMEKQQLMERQIMERQRSGESRMASAESETDCMSEVRK